MDPLFPRGVSHYVVGGLLIGAGVSLAFALRGLVTGMSTFLSSTWSWCSRAPFFRQERFTSSRDWRLALAVGLILGGALSVAAGVPTSRTAVTWWQLLLGGFLAGYGARLGNGCTSGHGICGLASFQRPSIVAVLTFLATAMATASVVSRLGGR